VESFDVLDRLTNEEAKSRSMKFLANFEKKSLEGSSLSSLVSNVVVDPESPKARAFS
jgi:hypothetical protein